jgi:hypothetical protein
LTPRWLCQQHHAPRPDKRSPLLPLSPLVLPPPSAGAQPLALLRAYAGHQDDFMQFLPEFLRLHGTCQFFVAAVYNRNGCLYLYLVTCFHYVSPRSCINFQSFMLFSITSDWHKQAITFPTVDYRLSFVTISVMERSHTMLAINIIKLILRYFKK